MISLNAAENNSQCYTLTPIVLGGCNHTSRHFDLATNKFHSGVQPIYIILFILGGLFFLSVVVNIADGGVRAVRKLQGRAQRYETSIQIEQPAVSQWPTWQTTTKVSKFALKTLRLFTMGALVLAIAIPLLKLDNFARSESADYRRHCPTISQNSVDGCQWISQWLVEALRQLFK